MTHFRGSTRTELDGLSLAEIEDMDSKDSLKTHANDTIYDHSVTSRKKESRFIIHKHSPGSVLLRGVLQICNTFFAESLWVTASKWICVITCVGQNN